MIALLILGGSFIYAQYFRYFVEWGKNPETAGAFTKNWVKVGQSLNSLPDEYQKYVIVNAPGVPVPYPKGIPMPAQTPMFTETTKYGKVRSNYLLPRDINRIKIEEGVIVLLNSDKSLLERLRGRFPQGEIIKKKNFSFIIIKK